MLGCREIDGRLECKKHITRDDLKNANMLEIKSAIRLEHAVSRTIPSLLRDFILARRYGHRSEFLLVPRECYSHIGQ